MRRIAVGLCVLAAVLIAAPAAFCAAKVVYTLDLEKASPACIQYKGSDKVKSEGKLPQPWVGNCWDANGTGELACEKDEKGGKFALSIRCLEGKAAMQLHMRPSVDVQGGKKYEVTLEYRTGGSAKGRVEYRIKDIDQAAVTFVACTSAGTGADAKAGGKIFELQASPNEYKTFTFQISVKSGAGKLDLNFSNREMGKENPFYFRAIKISELDADAPAPKDEAKPAAKDQPKPSPAPETKPK